jgi:hypothetical protein
MHPALPHTRHAELVSASIVAPALSGDAEKWTLKQVQGDEVGDARMSSGWAPLLLLACSAVGATTAWFLQKGLRIGALETRYSEFDKVLQPRRFWA